MEMINMNEGYVKLYAEDIDQINNSKAWLLFIHLLLSANYITESRRRGVVIAIGSVATTYGELAYQSGLKIEDIKPAIAILKRKGKISTQTIRGNDGFLIITINNWNKYQEDEAK